MIGRHRQTTEVQHGADSGTKSDLSVECFDGTDRLWVIEFEPDIGRWPRIEERRRQGRLELLEGDDASAVLPGEEEACME